MVMFQTKGAINGVEAVTQVPHLPSSVTVNASAYVCGPTSKLRF